MSCPGCQQPLSPAVAHCGSCGQFVGSPRDLAALAVFGATLLSIIGLIPNRLLSASIDGVRRGDPQGMAKLKGDFSANAVTIKGPGLGWDAEKFGEIVLVSFSYMTTAEEQAKRYMAWWVFEPATGKTTAIGNAAEFIDGFLLRRGVTSLWPDGLLPSATPSPSASSK
jgi:hypothetical protein